MSLPDSLQLALENHLTQVEAGSSNATADLARAIRSALAESRVDEASEALRRAVVPALDYTAAQALSRLHRTLAARNGPPPDPVRVAILSSSTSDQLTDLIELFLFATGVRASIYRAEYGVFRQEILDDASELHRFAPRFLFLATSWRDLGHRPALTDGRDAVRELAGREFGAWTGLWEKAHASLGCQVIQNNFDTPPWRALDNYEQRHPGSLGRYVSLMNRMFSEQAPPYVTVHDLDHLSAAAGRWEWGDERFYHHAKLPCGPEHLVDYAHSVSSLIAAQMGIGRKCLVLDLDNTLWGGVIGDDGLGGIRIGQGEGEGEAYLSFQRYVKDLRSRGTILAVCSKNDERIAREVFEKHTEMVLRLEDISCFVANWQDKATNLRAIAARLNIGLNSLVFVDDNPVERSIVRRLVPEVAVPELPEDPAGYVRALGRHRYFQVVSLNPEDFQRTEMYRANVAREQAESSSASLDDFLRSLEMTARVRAIDGTTLERSAQLVNRSNQFNLTTRRYSAGEIMAMARDPDWVTRTVSLADRFGDNGLISVVLAHCEDLTLRIDTWVMSCRVLKRGVEDLLLNRLVAIARERGLRSIRGDYIPTEKNGLVREHYSSLGFTRQSVTPAGQTSWTLDVESDWSDRPVFIEEVREDATAS